MNSILIWHCTTCKQTAIQLLFETIVTISYPWLWAGILLLIGLLLFLSIRWMVLTIIKQERAKAAYEKQVYTLQSRALTAQMNPHFIFNCLNSIKSLVQKNENLQAIDYLNLFSKLTRSLMQYNDRAYISLFDELTICQWYIDLEKLRFGDKIRVAFSIDDSLDTKQVSIPVLLIQPFIENAVWHGLVPKQEQNGILAIKVEEQGTNLLCTIDDNGIGRAASMRMNRLTHNHQSKGMSISQERINLHNSQQEKQVTINITDKFDDTGEPNGTHVAITFLSYRND
ncbi:MAG: histidine kinase [Bacteroidota bacterium]